MNTISLTGIELKNFRLFDYLDLKFGPGVNCLVGKNGSGKSSVLDAIQFSFTGRIPGGSKDKAIRRGCENGYVKLHFEVDGHPAWVQRYLGDSKVSSFVDGKIHRSADAAEEVLHELIGDDWSKLVKWVFIPAGETDAVLFDTPARREEALSVLFGTSGCSNVLKYLQGKSCFINSQIPASCVDSIEITFQEVQKKVEKLTKDLDKQKEAILSPEDLAVIDELISNHEFYSSVLSIIDKYDRLNSKAEGNKHRVDLLNQELNNFRIKESQIKSVIEYGKERFEKLNKRLSELQHWDNVVKRDIDNNTKHLADYSSELSKLKDSLPDVDKFGIDAFFEKYRDVVFYYDLCRIIGASVGNCTICGAEVPESFEISALPSSIEDAEKRVIAVEQEHKVNLHRVLDNTKLRQKIESRIVFVGEEIKKLQSYLSSYPARPEEVSEDERDFVLNYRADLELLNSVALQIRVVLGKINNSSVYENSTNISDSDYKILRSLPRDSLEDFIYAALDEHVLGDFDPPSGVNLFDYLVEFCEKYLFQSWTVLIRKFVDIKEFVLPPDRISDLRAKVQSHKAAEKLSDFIAKSLESDTQMLKSVREKLDKAVLDEAASAKQRLIVSRLREAEAVFRRDGLPAVIASRSIPNLNKAIAIYLSRFPSKFFKFSAKLTLDQNLVCSTEDGDDFPAAELSSGQRTMLAIAFRFAVRDMFANRLGFLSLDEPSATLDADNRACFADLLSTVDGQTDSSCPQVLLVTHHEDIASRFKTVHHL